MPFNPQLAKAIERMGRLERTVAQLALLPRTVARAAAPKLDRLVKRQFSSGCDPYGRPWRPITKETRRRRKGSKSAPPLTDTRKLRAGTGVKAAQFGARLVLGAPYGYFAQTGTRNMPARRIFPQFGLPAEWSRVLRETAREQRRLIMRRTA